MNLQVYRTNISTYQNAQFLTNEKKVLEEIPGISYIQSLQDIQEDVPFILISNTHTRLEEISKNILDNTVLLIHPNSGHDNLSLHEKGKYMFPIVLGNPIRANAVCEYTLSCIFQHFTKVPHQQYWPNERTWKRKLLRDQRVLILGYGHIGKLLCESLSPICREVRVYDPNEKDHSDVIHQWSESIFDDINVLIVAASLTDSSKKIIDHQVLKRLHPENLIINPARGEIIVEKDLIQYLSKNPKSFCFLDVYEKEPFDPGHLGEISNINKTAHIAGVYERLNKDIISFEYLIIKDFIEAYRAQNINQFGHEYKDCLFNYES